MADRPLEIRARLRDQMTGTLQRMRQGVRRFVSSAVTRFGQLARRLISLRGILATVLSGSVLIYWQKRIADMGVDLDTWATKLGTSAERLSALQFAVETSGFEFDALREGLKTLQERMDDASRGNVTYSEQFARLGVAVTDTDGNLRNVVDVLPEVAEGFRRVAGRGGAQDLVLITEDLIGGSENLLSVWLQQGPEAIRDALQRAAEVGAILDRAFTTAANRFARAWAEAVAVIRGTVAALFTSLEPYLTAGAEMLRQWASAIRLDPEGTIQRFLEGVRDVIADAIRIIGRGVAFVIRGLASFVESLEIALKAVLIALQRISIAILGLRLIIAEALGRDTTSLLLQLGEAASNTWGDFDAGSGRLRAFAAGTEMFTASLGSMLERLTTSMPWLDQYLARVRELQAEQPAPAGGDSDPVQEIGQMQQYLEAFGGQLEQVRSQWANMKQAGQDAARQVGASLQTGLAGALQSIAEGTKSAGEAFADFGKLVLRSIIGMIAQFAALVALAAAFNLLTGGGLMGAGGFFAPLKGFFGAAKGAAFHGGGVRAFAAGGVVDGPTPFTYGGGTRLGVMGEAGPEAILPLRRGAGGRLGVEAFGGGGGPQMVTNITFQGGGDDRRSQESMARQIEGVMLSLIEQPRVRRAFRAGRYG